MDPYYTFSGVLWKTAGTTIVMSLPVTTKVVTTIRLITMTMMIAGKATATKLQTGNLRLGTVKFAMRTCSLA